MKNTLLFFDNATTMLTELVCQKNKTQKIIVHNMTNIDRTEVTTISRNNNNKKQNTKP